MWPQGEALSLDYAPGKLDNGVLLDFGVVDRSSPKVRQLWGRLGTAALYGAQLEGEKAFGSPEGACQSVHLLPASSLLTPPVSVSRYAASIQVAFLFQHAYRLSLCIVNSCASPCCAVQPGYSLTLSLPQNDRNMDDKLDIAEMAGLGPAAVFQLTPGVKMMQPVLACGMRTRSMLILVFRFVHVAF